MTLPTPLSAIPSNRALDLSDFPQPFHPAWVIPDGRNGPWSPVYVTLSPSPRAGWLLFVGHQSYYYSTGGQNGGAVHIEEFYNSAWSVPGAIPISHCFNYANSHEVTMMQAQLFQAKGSGSYRLGVGGAPSDSNDYTQGFVLLLEDDTYNETEAP